jgi:hypothetical protein
MDGERKERRDENAEARHRAGPQNLCDAEELPRRERRGNGEHAGQRPVAVPHRAKHDGDGGEREENALREIR